MGCTYQRGKVWWIKYNHLGRPLFESSHSENRTDAINLLKRREGASAAGAPVLPKVGRFTFQDARRDFLTDRRNNSRNNGPGPMKKLEARIDNHLTPFFGRKRMAEITAVDVRAYTAHRLAETVRVTAAKTVVRENGVEELVPEVRRPVSNASVNRELAILKRMFSLAIQAGVLMSKPHIAMLRERNTRVGFFEPEQFASICRHLPDSLRPVVTFAHITGWRVNSEILPLQWRQVDFQSATVRLDAHTTKNDEGRLFPMTPELRTLLLERQRVTEELRQTRKLITPWVFFRMVAKGRRGDLFPKPILTYSKAWKVACRAAGCPDRIPHDLRRTAVRNMVRAGIPERVAMQLTGHKTRSVFERYNIVSEGDLVDAARRLTEFSRLQAASL